MPPSTATHVANLRKALRKLEPAGEAGFEGFLALVLSLVCGQPFRLASSGSQRGRDGDSAFDGGATYFEAKRYDDDVPKKEISVKLADLMADNGGQVDTWIIGATAPVPALHAEDFRQIFHAAGIGIVLLDWSSVTNVPPLAVLAVMGGQTTKDFLSAHLTDPADASVLTNAHLALDTIPASAEYLAQAENLRRLIQDPSVGLGLAKAANRRWLEKVFADSKLARHKFGQPLAPNDVTMNYLQPRVKLSQQFQSAFTGPPSSAIFAVIGPEGAGKSWLVANTWMNVDPASVLVFVSSADVREQDIVGFEDFLIRKLIEQTDGGFTETNRKRWERRFIGWRANPDPKNVRVTLCIDGLNQRPRFRWSRLIDAASLFLGELGGNVVVTTQMNHFPAIRQSSAADKIRINVPEWTKTEIDAILRSRGVDPDVLSSGVFQTLKNPRLLSLAVNLIDARDIEQLEQLSVGRLLFEHLRAAELSGYTDLSAREFSKVLSDIAADYVQRLDQGQQDDLTLFDARDHARLEAAASSRFFKPLNDDPDQYEIGEDGLLLALGIWLVKALETERRNKRDPFVRLDIVMEPVAQLPFAAEIIASAMEVACISEDSTVEVAAALIRHFVSLQNTSDSRRDAFDALVRKKPDAFVRAAKDSALEPGRGSDTDWLGTAILRARDHKLVRDVLEREIPEWLSYYSLDPDRSAFPSGNEDQAQANLKREKLQDQIEKKISNLAEGEKDFIHENMTVVDDGDLAQLHNLAFFLAAGLPLQPLAKPLLAWAIGDALNTSYSAPRKEFEALLRFNRVDWKATREAIRDQISVLGPSRSTVGDWSVVRALLATGDPADAAEADLMIDVLNKDRSFFPGSRLVESYCATDPCDPDSPRPDNIEKTALEFDALAIDQAFLSIGLTPEAQTFAMAMPGLARFEPQSGVRGVKRLATDMLSRDLLARRQAALALLPHSVLLDSAVVNELISFAQSTAIPHENLNVSDAWVTTQYSLFMAVPHLDPEAQWLALAGLQSSAILLDLMKTLKPAGSSFIKRLIEIAITDGDSEKLVRLVGAIHHTGSKFTLRTAEAMAGLMNSDDGALRAQVLATAASSRDETLLRHHAESDWDAGSLEEDKHSFEIWYGSVALIEAAAAGFLSIEEALNRTALSQYGFAAERLGEVGASLVADRIGLALRKVLGLGEITDVPDMEVMLPDAPLTSPPMVNVDEKTTPADPATTFARLAETDKQFQERQRRLHHAYDRFTRELSIADARLVMDDMTSAGMEAILTARPEMIFAWGDLLTSVDKRTKQNLHLFAVQFAGAISGRDPDLAARLFRTYAAVEPFVRHVRGPAKIPVEADVIWHHAGAKEIADVCLYRMENLTSDREIALEVLAATIAGQEALLKLHVDRLISSAEPVQIALGLTIAGFMDESDHAVQTLARFRGSSGFIGVAQQASQAAYDRNRWARHWYSILQSATEPLEFWRAAVLLCKIVDGRIAHWARHGGTDTFASTFFPTIEADIKRRIAKWSDKRKATLFGGKTPHLVFLLADG